MRLSEAVKIVMESAGEARGKVHLLCGFTPLHLETFVKARLKIRFPDHGANLITGLYGDLEGSLRKARAAGGDGAIVVIEWSDLDQRLGLRASAGWPARTLEDIVAQVGERCARMEALLIELAAVMPVTLVACTLQFPPFTHMPPLLTSTWELRLNACLSQLLSRVCARSGVRLLNENAMALRSPHAARHDVKMDLLAGFPYSLAHADAVAEASVECLFPATPKKGIITDLDLTLWNGILGDVGPDGVSWSLEDKSQGHALYQQVLASLADSGVLVGVASKNDADLVAAAFQRADILLKPAQVFPVEANWGVKSDAVGRILEVWNIGADSVVFVDDSPMELAEVAEKYPGIECLRFPSEDPGAILSLLWQLREHFGKSEIREEDRLRLESLRNSAALKQETASSDASPDFLSRLGATVTFEDARADARAFELVNKTNQFNLNGARYTEAEWKSLSLRPGGFLATVSYDDRFGPLGKIVVLGGRALGNICCVDLWVMSCRAFSRHIEFQTIRQLFAKTGASALRFQFKPTQRNGPLQSFLALLFRTEAIREGELELDAGEFRRLCPELFHQVNDKWTLSEKN